jgi:hypothetical protein
MVLAAILLAAAVLIDPAHCRQTRIGPAEWSSDGRGGLSASMDARTLGNLSLRCRVPVPAGAQNATISYDKLLISFQPAGSKAVGGGLLLEAGSCKIELLRVAGEDWIETPSRAWSVPVSGRTLDVTITMRDNSVLDPVRVDLTGLRLLPGRAENAEVCQPVDDKLNGNGGKHEPH